VNSRTERDGTRKEKSLSIARQVPKKRQCLVSDVISCWSHLWFPIGTACRPFASAVSSLQSAFFLPFYFSLPFISYTWVLEKIQQSLFTWNMPCSITINLSITINFSFRLFHVNLIEMTIHQPTMMLCFEICLSEMHDESKIATTSTFNLSIVR